jgi:hypothetical protein
VNEFVSEVLVPARQTASPQPAGNSYIHSVLQFGRGHRINECKKTAEPETLT